MPIILSQKNSIALGLGLLGAFFIGSGVVIYFHNSARIPPSSSLERQKIEGEEVLAAPTPGGSAIGFVLNEFHRSSVKDGKMVWEIYGKKGRYDVVNNTAEVEEPRLTVNRENGVTIKLTAARALLSLAGTDLLKAELFDNVIVTYKDETTIKTKYAVYVKATESVEIPNLVEVDSPLFSIRARQLSAKVDAQEIIMKDGVKSTFKPRKR